MKTTVTIPRHDSNACRREQELCVDALATGAFDEMSDRDWVAMCERIAREAADAERETADVPAGAGD